MTVDSNTPLVYVILGATGGIGAAVSRRLAETGAQFVLGARTESGLHALAAETGGAVFPLDDATSFEEVQNLIDYASDAFGRIDGIINTVGSTLLKPTHLTSRPSRNTASKKPIVSTTRCAVCVRRSYCPCRNFSDRRLSALQRGTS